MRACSWCGAVATVFRYGTDACEEHEALSTETEQALDALCARGAVPSGEHDRDILLVERTPSPPWRLFDQGGPDGL